MTSVGAKPIGVKPVGAKPIGAKPIEAKPLREQIFGNEKLLTSLYSRAASIQLPSLMIFAGPNGIGKKMSALALSQELICPNGPPACGACGTCLRIRDEKSEDMLVIAPETAQIKIEQSRQIEQFVQLRKLGRARTVIIEQSHRLNPQSSNALLKLFEEPPPNTYIFLITANPHQLIATIRSRAQLFRFAPLTDEQMKLLTGAENWILKMARGQIDLVHLIKDNSKTWSESKKQAVQFISDALGGGGDIFSRMKEIAGDRETSLQNILVWQSLFRDALVKALRGTDVLNDEKVVADLAAIDSEMISEVSSYLVSMEQDLNANVDRTLMLENFYFKVLSLRGQSL